MMTKEGVAHLERSLENWRNHILRNQAARNALLSWLYDQRTYPRGAVNIESFFSDPRSSYNGDFFSLSDIDDAASYLEQNHLIDGTGVDQRRGPLLARITASGMDSIEQGGTVDEYLKQPANTSVSYSFNAPVYGTNIAIGDNATINNMDADSLRTLMKAITEALPGLGMSQEDQSDTEDTTIQVFSNIGQDPNQIGHASAPHSGGCENSSSRAENQALAAVLSAAIDYERAKLGLPPAS